MGAIIDLEDALGWYFVVFMGLHIAGTYVAIPSWFVVGDPTFNAMAVAFAVYIIHRGRIDDLEQENKQLRREIREQKMD